MFDQIAIYSEDVERDVGNLKAAGFLEWTRDIVTATATVSGNPEPVEFRAKLAFNYDVLDGGVEFEFIEPLSFPNYVQIAGTRPGGVAHLGIHVDNEQHLERVKADLMLGAILQSTRTIDHTNSAVPASRRYRYVLWWSSLFPFPIKTIERLDV